MLQTQGSAVALDTVPYGAQGPFAVNIWFKVTSVVGSDFEYIYSHASNGQDAVGFGPNQVGWLLNDSRQWLTYSSRTGSAAASLQSHAPGLA